MIRISTLAVCLLLLTSSLVQAEGRRIAFTLRHAITPGKPIGQIRLTVQIPQDVPGLQDVRSVRYSHKPEKEFDENGDRYATFAFELLDQPVDLDIDVEVEVYRYDLETAKIARRLIDPPDVLDRFRGSEKYLESDAPEIQDIVKKLASDSDDDEKIRNVMDYVLKNMNWNGYNPGEVGALGALEKKGGDCSEFSDVFVTLCRASGLPARVCEGYVTTPVAKGDTQKHAWAEVYHSEYGWVPFDPMWIETNSTLYEKRSPVYILFSRQRNHPRLSNGHFAAWTWGGGKLDVVDTYTIHSQTELPKKPTTK